MRRGDRDWRGRPWVEFEVFGQNIFRRDAKGNPSGPLALGFLDSEAHRALESRRAAGLA